MMPFLVLPRPILACSSRQPLCFHILAASLSSPKKSTPLESNKSRLFFQNTRGGVYPPFLSALESDLPGFGFQAKELVTPFPPTLPNLPSHKSSVCHTSEKEGWGLVMVNHATSQRVRRSTQNPSAQAPTRVERPLGALSDCSEARRSFSKLVVPASCLASLTAFSAARASYPRFTSAESTSDSTPAGDAAAGFAASMATASSLSFSSTTMRSAVLRPTPGIRVRRTKSPPRIAGTSSSTLMPDRILRARDGPTPEAESSSSKKCFSRDERKP